MSRRARASIARRSRRCTTPSSWSSTTTPASVFRPSPISGSARPIWMDRPPTLHSMRTRVRKSMRSTRRRWPPAAATTAHPACGRTTTPTITRPSCWIRMDTTSRQSVMQRRDFFVAVAALSLAALQPSAFAQTWPDKPIKFVVAAGPGSSLDTLARVIGDKLKDRRGQSVIVENKPAAGGTVATAEVAKSAPDGYTMLLGFNGPLAFGPLLQKLPYDVQKDLAPVIITSSQPNVLAVNAQLPAKTLKELVAYAKANPGKLAYASVGNGSSSHLNMELLKSVAGFDALAWNGIMVPAGTPKPVIAKLNAEINAVLKEPDVVAKMNAQGFDLIGGTPEDFGNLIRRETDTWGPVIKKVGLKID